MINLYILISISFISYFMSFLEIEYLCLIWMILFLMMIIRKKTHFSMFLICMELMSMTILIISIHMLIKMFIFAPLFFLIICFSVGEACVGLSMIVFLSRIMTKELLMENIQ